MEFRDGSERESSTEGKNHNVLLEEDTSVKSTKLQACKLYILLSLRELLLSTP